MFIENKYKRWYDAIVKKAQSLNRTKTKAEYLEDHHVVPRCMGGTNDSSNMVLLTGREHFICHWLLTKCVDESHLYKITYAFSSMITFKDKRRLSSVQYERARATLAHLWTFPERRSAQSESTKAAWRDPEKRARLMPSIVKASKAALEPSSLAKRTEAIKENWKSADRTARGEAIRKTRSTLESRSKTSEASRLSWQSSREKRIEALTGAMSKPETKKKMSDGAKRGWEKRRKRMEVVT